MENASIFAVFSILVVFISLCIGAYTDIKTRTCPKKIWYIAAPIAAVSTLCWYIQLLTSPDIYGINYGIFIGTFATSVVLCISCVFMGYRMGNGGDWRSLFCVSLLTPWVAAPTLILSCVFGGLHLLIVWYQHREDKTFSPSIPWMVAITIAFGLSTLGYVFI